MASRPPACGVTWARSMTLSLGVRRGGQGVVTLRGAETCNPSPAFSQTPPQTNGPRGGRARLGGRMARASASERTLPRGRTGRPLPVPAPPRPREGPRGAGGAGLPRPRGTGMAGQRNEGLRPGASRGRHAGLRSSPGARAFEGDEAPRRPLASQGRPVPGGGAREGGDGAVSVSGLPHLEPPPPAGPRTRGRAGAPRGRVSGSCLLLKAGGPRTVDRKRFLHAGPRPRPQSSAPSPLLPPLRKPPGKPHRLLDGGLRRGALALHLLHLLHLHASARGAAQG